MRKRILSALLAALVALFSIAAIAEEEEIYTGEQIQVDDVLANEDLPNETWNILLLGTDNREKLERRGRTDSMIILSIDLPNKTAKLTSLMRDTWVHIEGHGNAKLNAACVYGGPALTMKTINQYFDLNLEKYILVNITGLADIIDLLGGVDVTVSEEERKALNQGLFDLSSASGMEMLETSGENTHLNGNQAVAFARIRKIDSDYRRTERQREVLTAMANRLKTVDAAQVTTVINTLLPYAETNLDLTELATLGYVGLQIDTSALGQLRLPADGTFESGTYNGVWCIKPNFETNKAKLHEFIYGE